MATSKAEYHRNVLDQVLAAAGWRPDQAHMAFDALQKRIDELPDATLLLAGVADFWLDLSKQQGAKRRKALTPTSPFFPSGRKVLGKKGPIAVWDEEWRRLEAAKVMAPTRSAGGRELYAELITQPAPWFMGWVGDQAQVIGHAAWLPTAYLEEAFANQAIDTLDVQWLHLDQVLRLPWRNREEAHTWLAIVRACHRMIEADLEQVRMDLDSGEATGAPRDGGRI